MLLFFELFANLNGVFEIRDLFLEICDDLFVVEVALRELFDHIFGLKGGIKLFSELVDVFFGLKKIRLEFEVLFCKAKERKNVRKTTKKKRDGRIKPSS